MELGKLYLIPTTLGDTEPLEVLPISIKRIIEQVDDYIAENEKAARRFIKKVSSGKAQGGLNFQLLNKFTEAIEIQEYLNPCLEGRNIGLMSDAGCPGVADPGAEVVRLAHSKGIQVIPLVGPSSILMAMMASGMNGQSFAFNGYLPIDKSERKAAIKKFEKRSKELNQSQAFIETPYRNDKLLSDFKSALSEHTRLCIACDITLPTEYIKTQYISEWKKTNIELHKRPCIFIIHRE
ncbi:SAM-dependent methyltransferase [Leptobacterium flavescens]|uniref:SAM-dependent methyltransferase n=1 Tax=Leptobacterium flavescens TaxID=472055 RepID=A0A6P0UN66_9FLAO|nr:SAM-dependent methyltransferase [Leptobacterium flavescens]NER13289.1 SAM-dependent methyltransferase [Leptobacterium flavescens]